MKTSDRYVNENGVAVIRPLDPYTKKPMPTDAEKDAAIAKFEQARAAYWASLGAHNRSK